MKNLTLWQHNSLPEGVIRPSAPPSATPLQLTIAMKTRERCYCSPDTFSLNHIYMIVLNA